MSIAITEDHRALAETVRGFADKRDLRGAARARLGASDDVLPEFWGEFAELGWLGLHLPEDVGGSGYGIDELVVVVEELARAVAPGPFVPSVIASAVVAAAGDDDLKLRARGQRLIAGGLNRADMQEGVARAIGQFDKAEALVVLPIGDLALISHGHSN